MPKFRNSKKNNKPLRGNWIIITANHLTQVDARN